jgi:phosphohistidine phosphatase
MKTLVLFRHGKSDWDAEFDSDQERPLNKRGKRDAKRMGRFLAGLGAVPERVVTSSAVRAVKTVGLAAEAGGWGSEIMIEKQLYKADPGGVIAVIQEQADTLGTLLVVGHEPAFSATASFLIGGGTLRFSTGAMACIEFEVERWADVRAGGGLLLWLVGPKMVGESGEGE